MYALREEGDLSGKDAVLFNGISIHALREEGDLLPTCGRLLPPAISIHALREEGDQLQPGINITTYEFLSTPSE